VTTIPIGLVEIKAAFPADSVLFRSIGNMGISKLKDALKKAQNDSPNDHRLLRKLKSAVRKKRDEGFKPAFPGAHRGY
jgi:hypothetical protein